jgi:hypothetical protein
MKLCNGCKNAGDIISLQAALKAAEAHTKTLGEQNKERNREIDRQALEMGNLRLKLRNYRLEIEKPPVGGSVEGINGAAECGGDLP